MGALDEVLGEVRVGILLLVVLVLVLLVLLVLLLVLLVLLVMLVPFEVLRHRIKAIGEVHWRGGRMCGRRR